MPAPILIPTTPPPLDSMRFDVLLKAGIDACQRLSGERWTDYNEHDPGVTILEQVCYALTDVGYRVNYGVADLVEVPPGTPSAPGRATFHPGDRILSCEPVTPEDYQELFYDRIHKLKNAWLEVADDAPGLYSVWIEPVHGISADDVLRLRREVFSVFHRHRNLGDDLRAVEVLDPLIVQVRAAISISADAEPAQAAADALFQVQNLLTPHTDFESVADALQAGRSPDEIFDGPWLRHGLFDGSRLAARRTTLAPGEVRDAILRRKEVYSLVSLELAVAGPPQDGEEQGSGAATPVGPQDYPSREPDHDGVYRAGSRELFALDADNSASQITVLQRGRQVQVDAEEVRRLLAQRRAEYTRLNSLAEQREKLLAYRQTPRGVYREPGRYDSIQHQFPLTYGIGAYGVPDQPGLDGAQRGPAARTQRVAQARQLKAWLAFFEQILANHFAQLEHIGTLFSTQVQDTRSYFSQPLAHAEPRPWDAPDIAAILLPPPPPTSGPGDTLQVRLHGRLRIGRHAERPGAVLLQSRLFTSPDDAARLANELVRVGQHAHAYAAIPSGIDYLVALRSEGQIIAVDPRPHRSAHTAHRAARRTAAWVRTLAENGGLRHRYLLQAPRGPYRLVVDDADGRVLLDVAGLTLATLKELTRQLPELGQRPNRYVIPRRFPGHLRLLLDTDVGHVSVEFADTVKSVGEAYALRERLMAWFGKLACNEALRLAHMRGSPPPPAVGDPVSHYADGVERIVARFDPGVDRRHVFLDHLLARFDERFDDTGLERALPPDLMPRARFRRDLLRVKARMVDALAPGNDDDTVATPLAGNLGGRRGAGCMYTDPQLGSRSGIEERLRLLLCVGGPNAAPVTLDTLRHGPVVRADDPYAGEDLCVVEHVLLRQRTPAAGAPPEAPSGARGRASDAYRVALVFPASPARFHVPDFRALAYRVALDNCPAHLELHVLWLEDADMTRFRGLHADWRESLAQAYRGGTVADADGLPDVDRAARRLLDFLRVAEKAAARERKEDAEAALR